MHAHLDLVPIVRLDQLCGLGDNLETVFHVQVFDERLFVAEHAFEQIIRDSRVVHLLDGGQGLAQTLVRIVQFVNIVDSLQARPHGVHELKMLAQAFVDNVVVFADLLVLEVVEVNVVQFVVWEDDRLREVVYVHVSRYWREIASCAGGVHVSARVFALFGKQLLLSDHLLGLLLDEFPVVDLQLFLSEIAIDFHVFGNSLFFKNIVFHWDVPCLWNRGCKEVEALAGVVLKHDDARPLVVNSHVSKSTF